MGRRKITIKPLEDERLKNVKSSIKFWLNNLLI